VQYARALNAPFIVGYHVVAATSDAGQFGPLLQRIEALCGRRPKQIIADGKYAGPMELALARELGIVEYAPTGTTNPKHRSGKKQNRGFIPKTEFVWLPEEQTYRCPQGHMLRYIGSGTDTRQQGKRLKLMQYRCPPEYCRECPIRLQCTRTPEHGRLVKRNEHDDLVEELQKRMQQSENQALYRHRKQTVELSYADLKEHRGLRQFHAYGLRQAKSQVAMIVLAVNGMALLKAREAMDIGKRTAT
jgi:hypothetical protein